ncbi:MAG: sigma-70 family RNA polymerase sigma factor [Flavobacteriales bacterium]|nr:sigma-70 family RNA polymerase sigma factor [Flavobacteriales bacterium]
MNWLVLIDTIKNWDNNSIIKGCIKFNPEARRILYEKYSSQMFSICLRYANNNSDVEDIFQEGFFKIYQNIGQVKNPEALSGWIRKIFVNVALEYNRKGHSLRVVIDNDAIETSNETTINSAIDNLSLEELTTLIQSLPTGCKTVFNMYAVDGYSHQEIAEALGISIGTSKSQLFVARQILQKKIIIHNQPVNKKTGN